RFCQGRGQDPNCDLRHQRTNFGCAAEFRVLPPGVDRILQIDDAPFLDGLSFRRQGYIPGLLRGEQKCPECSLIACVSAPFSAAGTAMCLYMATVERRLSRQAPSRPQQESSARDSLSVKNSTRQLRACPLADVERTIRSRSENCSWQGSSRKSPISPAILQRNCRNSCKTLQILLRDF